MKNEEEIWEDTAFQTGTSFAKRFRKSQKSQGLDKFSPNLKEIVGLCYKCGNYNYIINDVHQLVYSKCGYYNMTLGRHSVKECSSFQKRQSMSLEYMFSIATYIEIQKKEAGFLTTKDKK